MSTRKKRNRPARRRLAPNPLLSSRIDLPVWEYREYAHAVAADTEQTADEVLRQLLATPIRLLRTGTGRVVELLPADLVREVSDPDTGGVDLDEWLSAMELMHEGGFCTWDAATRAHHLTSPGQRA